jgi:DNA anti-recombination protein RmuC
MIRDLGQVVARHHDQLAQQQREIEEHRQHIRQIFSRMEQGDARFEEMTREYRARMAEHDARFAETSAEIRRILDAIERRGGDGGRRVDA